MKKRSKRRNREKAEVRLSARLHSGLGARGGSAQDREDEEAPLLALPHLGAWQAERERQEALRHVHEGCTEFLPLRIFI